MAREEAEQDPRVGSVLPNAEDATIDPAKLRQYALDRDHPLGRHKAAVFERALGIGIDDWEYLSDALLERMPLHPVTGSRAPTAERDRRTWEVLVPVTGLGDQSGRVLRVITAWEMLAGKPNLVTVRVAPRSRQ